MTEYLRFEKMKCEKVSSQVTTVCKKPVTLLEMILDKISTITIVVHVHS